MAVFRWKKRTSEHFGESWVPVATLEIQDSGGVWRKLAAQIDSGAVISFLKRSVSDLLGIDLTAGRPVSLTGVGGSTISAYVHELETRFASDLILKVPYAIADTEDVPNLLGRNGFFDRLQVDFDATLQETSLRAPWGNQDDARIRNLLIETSQHILDRWDDLGVPGPARDTVRLFVERASQLYVAIEGLARLHRAYISPSLIRILYDLSLQFEYIMSDPERLTQDYREFEHITRHKNSQAILQRGKGMIAKFIAQSPLREEGEARNKAEYERVRKRSESRKGKLHQNWHGMSIHDLAAQVCKFSDFDWLSEYELWYKLGSGWEHADPFYMRRLLPFEGKENRIATLLAQIYVARILRSISSKIVLTSEQHALLEELSKGID